MEDLFFLNDNDIVEDVREMSKDDFIEKSKSLLIGIDNDYSKCWVSKRLEEIDYPLQSMCDKCTGCGEFTLNGEVKECVQDREQGDCFYRIFNSEEFASLYEQRFEQVMELLSINKIN